MQQKKNVNLILEEVIDYIQLFPIQQDPTNPIKNTFQINPSLLNYVKNNVLYQILKVIY